jgi:outer membrane protein assembly factor BamB
LVIPAFNVSPEFLAMRFAVAFLLLLGSSVVARAADWPQWRGPNRDGGAPASPALIDALPAEGLKPAWVSEKLPGGFGGGWGSPIIVGDRAYLFIHHKIQKTPGEVPKKKFPYLAEDKRGGMSPAEFEEYEKNRRAEELALSKLFEFKEDVHCLDAASGRPIWMKSRTSVYSRFVQSGTLTFADGRLFILGAGRKAHCLDAATGDDVWEAALPGEHVDEYYMSSFAVADGLASVFCGSLFALDAKTGAIVWQGDEKKTKGSHTSPIVWQTAGQSFVLANVGGETACFAARTGAEAWRVKSEANHSTPVLVGDRLLTYGSSRRSGLRCYEISPTGAKEVWAYQRASDKGSSPVVVGNHVYVQGEKRLACVDLATGDEQWNTTLDLSSPQYTSLVAVDGKVIYAFDGLLCFAADPREFRPLIVAKFDKTGLMATEQSHRQHLKLDEVEKKDNGLEEATRIFKREVGDQGPLACTTPAVADGRLYLRLRDRLACYDLRVPQAATGAASTTAR